MEEKMKEKMKEEYQAPFAEKVEFDYKEQVSASFYTKCFTSYGKNPDELLNPCPAQYSGAAYVG